MADKANGVQRWEVDFSVGYEGSHAAAWMAKADDGEYVSYADYEQLQAKLEAAERERDEYREEWQTVLRSFSKRSEQWCAAEARAEAAERDAARWRYVRNRHDDREDTLCVTIHDGAMVEDAYLLDVECVDLQAAIDAAMEVTNA